jgi:putative acetyltransferase
MLIRPESPEDFKAIHDVISAAFSSRAEADLVDRLRAEAQNVIALVAEDGGVVVGHIMFSPVTLSGGPERAIAGLGPLAVDPPLQKRGIGGLLIRAGIAKCKLEKFGAVVVLGHPDYYPRFGFAPAREFGLRWERGHDEAFFAIELESHYLRGVSGVIAYHRAFDGA